MTLACGGHPLPLVLRASGAVEPVGRLGTLLGADVEPVLDRRRRSSSRAGDLLVLYTDGVTEVRAGREELFGHRDLAALLGALRAACRPTRSPQRVQDAVLDAAGGRPRDDIAILVARPATAPRRRGSWHTPGRADDPRRHTDG